ncbi:UDP-N-acetylmuramate--L-alanine ligase [Helicobacter muridarum]|uniref:UDP-N-acetylmuramate--L-alanine ligase n=1 Tax=Helicobacter muridarum TaxID=216 RepID=A0A099TX91_9HELI|nr:Mur ligase domain-containing protein [Helicobacter muridarum]TLE01125.1 UDP-N-acetylmuramate--L-alanine ligase [Helicobacter muridarum]STQ85992.1 UDP-N-acetylmuramate--alanine ligase [Helicobacter muridarum]
MDFYNVRVHIIGIGGIGVSGLARFLKAQGAIVSGSDIVQTTITQGLQKEGIDINIPHAKDAIANKDIIIHSAIIKDSNIEIKESKKLNKTILSRKEALKILLKNKQVLSICAAHGKSSTSAILSAILKDSGAIIGAISKELQSNVRVSADKILVFEADESDKSFLNSNPYKSIIINAEAEHLESYENSFAKLKQAYKEFIYLSKEAIVNMECESVREIIDDIESSTNQNIVNTATTNHSNIDSNMPKITRLYPSRDIHNISYILQDGLPYTNFNLRDLGQFQVYGIGWHNALNASMAILSSLDLIPLDLIKKNLLNFIGIKKRFDILQHLIQDAQSKQVLKSINQDIHLSQEKLQQKLANITKIPCIIDDYAHHPTEIKATLNAARVYASLLEEVNNTNKDSFRSLHITAIFQPHKYSRLRDNIDAFRACFDDCDSLVILPVWAAGEQKIDFDFARLFGHYKPIFANHIKRFGNHVALIDKDDNTICIIDSDIIIGLGAGDITYQLRGEK